MDKELIMANDFQTQWEDTHSQTLNAVDRVGKSGWLVLGQEVASFETELAEYCNISHATGCASGLDALEIGLKCLGIAPGDKVLTTPLSAFATTLAIIRAGGVPVFVDVDQSGLMDFNLIEQSLTDNPDIKYLMPVHLFGHAMNLEKMADIKQRFGLNIVEDCCQAIGASYQGIPVGSVGDCGTLSFYPTKNLGAMGDGGALISNDSALAEKSKCFRDYGQTGKYEHELLGLNSRLDELHAAILRDALLPKLAEFTQKRETIARKYTAEISNPALEKALPDSTEGSVWHLYPGIIKGDRNAFLDYLEQNKISGGVHYPKLISDQKALDGIAGVQTLTPLTNAHMFANQEVSLPIHPYMTDEQIDRVIDACNRWST